MNSEIWNGCTASADERFISFVADLRGWPSEFVRWCVAQSYLGAKDGDVVFPAFNVSGEIVALHRRVGVRKWIHEPQGAGPFAATTYGMVASGKAVFLFESPWDGLTFLLILWNSQPDQRERLLVNICIIVTDGAASFARADMAIPAGAYSLAVVMQNDPPESDGKPSPAERWLAGLVKVLGAKLNTVSPPAGIKDLNDWAKSGATLAVMRNAILGAVGSYTRTVVRSIPADRTAPQPVPEPQSDEQDNDRAAAFPTDLLPPTLHKWVVEVARIDGVDPALPAIVALAMVSAALGKHMRARLVGPYVSSANEFFMAIAPSGGSKTTVMNRGAKAIRKVESELMEAWQRETKPRLLAELTGIEALRDKMRKQPPKSDAPDDAWQKRLQELAVKAAEVERKLKQEPRLCVEDVTPEKLATLLDNDTSTVALISAEPGDAIAVLRGGRYRKGGESSDSPFIKGWSLEKWDVDRIGRGATILPEPCLSMCWLLQPCRWEKLLEGDMIIRGGLLPRILVAEIPMAAGPASQPTAVDEVVLASFDELIEALLRRSRLMPGTSEIPVSAEVRELLEQFRLERDNAHRAAPGDLGVFAIRHAEHACRLTLLLHCAHYGVRAPEVPISYWCASVAIALVNWFAGQQNEFLAIEFARAQKNALKDLLGWFEKNPGLGASARDLKRAGAVSDARVLDQLVTDGVLSKQVVHTGGRSKTLFSLAQVAV